MVSVRERLVYDLEANNIGTKQALEIVATLIDGTSVCMIGKWDDDVELYAVSKYRALWARCRTIALDRVQQEPRMDQVTFYLRRYVPVFQPTNN
jgi:hypothetical protein